MTGLFIVIAVRRFEGQLPRQLVCAVAPVSVVQNSVATFRWDQPEAWKPPICLRVMIQDVGI